jgi:hypothetical protein
LTLWIAGCATVQPGSQSAEVQAERTLTIALASIDSFLRFEAAHRSDLPASVAAIAIAVRRDAPRALTSANVTRMAYKSNRSGGEASLWTALAVVESLVGQVRVWLPQTPAGSSAVQRRHTLELEAEAKPSQAPGSFTMLVPLFVDLAKEIFKAVNESRAAAAQSAEWTPQQDAAFAAKLATTLQLPHWQ